MASSPTDCLFRGAGCPKRWVDDVCGRSLVLGRGGLRWGLLRLALALEKVLLESNEHVLDFGDFAQLGDADVLCENEVEEDLLLVVVAGGG